MTINKRLQDIKDTDLQIDQFKNIWIENEENPPAFKRALNDKIFIVLISKLHIPI